MSPLRVAWRILIIAAIVWLSTARYVVGRIGTLFVRGKDERRAAVARLRGRILRDSMERLGATFIKLGQVMSTRPDLFEPELIDELRVLQDQLPPFSADDARRIVEQDLGGPVEKRFAAFDAPIAAGSVAQVHRAELHDGTEVAVKILRPDVHAQVERDAAILLGWARLLELLPSVRASAPREHLAHFVRGIVEQTDLRQEAANYATFRKNFASFEGVRFPRVYEDLSGPQVLTMEYVRGRKVDALGPGNHGVVVDRLRNALLKMLFEDGFVHADMHPGNFVVTDAREIAIFDVGLVKGLTDEMLVQYIDWNRCLVMGTTDDYVRHVRTYYVRDRDDVKWDELTRDVDDFAKSFRGKTAAEIEAKDLINQALAIGRKYGLRPVTEMTLILVAVITCEGVGKQLDPTSDSFAKIAEYLTPILARRGMLTA
ncbi:MAG TPA: AarF/UbiB family protein [Polyangiaceae bacterium]|nr:AarF/UbiB family protein [Polyangiaceae bacterium]